MERHYNFNFLERDFFQWKATLIKKADIQEIKMTVGFLCYILVIIMMLKLAKIKIETEFTAFKRYMFF